MPPNDADVAAIAADTARESAEAVPHPDLNRGSAPADTGPVDNWGRSFDPKLHLANKLGQPALTRKGKLMVLKGMQGGPAAVKAATATQSFNGGTLDLEAAGLGGAPEGGEAAPGATAAGQMDPNADPLKMQAKAAADAEMIREGVEAFCRLIAGEKGELKPGDAKKLDVRWEDALTENMWSLPIGKLTMALWETGRNVGRASLTPEGKERLKSAWDWLTGKPPAPRDGRPLRRQEPKPEPEEEEAPRQSYRRPVVEEEEEAPPPKPKGKHGRGEPVREELPI